MAGEGERDQLCVDIFDHIDDFMDFPNEDNVDGKICDGMEIWPSDRMLGGMITNCFFSAVEHGVAFDHPEEFPLPQFEDMDWLSNFVQDSFADSPAVADASNLVTLSGSSSNNNLIDSKDRQFCPAPSPVSVLESTSKPETVSSHANRSDTTQLSSSSSHNNKDDAHLPSSVTARARSKRPRLPAFPARITNNNDEHAKNASFIIPPTSSATSRLFFNYCPSIVQSAELDPFGESKPQLKSKVIKSGGCEGIRKTVVEQSSVRKCLHCEITKTPQWRMGPMGPKTLCNACGVRFKSGRLFPEYRPAASPTFVASKHSNSHKKVVEMRIKKRAAEYPGLGK